MFWIRIGLISGYTAAFVFLVGTTAAILAYPDYSFFGQFISELGVRRDIMIEGILLQEALYPEILNITLILSGLFFLPLFPLIYYFFNPEQLWRKILTIGMVLAGLCGGVFLSLVGVFDAGMFFWSHVTVALGTYFSITAMFLLWGAVVIALEEDSLYKKSKLWIIDPIVCVIGIIIGIINTGLFDLYLYLGGEESLAFYQKALAYLFVILFSYVGVRILFVLRKFPERFTTE
jgi:hypothetical protein